MADAKIALDTPSLLKLDPKVALSVIAGYHNDQVLTPDYLNISAPVVLQGRETEVNMVPNPYYQNTGGLGRDYTGSFTMRYKRLDYAVFFEGEEIEVEMDLPSDTRALARALGEQRDIAFSDDDVELIPIGTNTDTVRLAATPRSLRWIGETTVKVLYIPTLFDVIPTAYMNGLTMFSTSVDLDIAIYGDGTLSAFDPFYPQPYLTYVVGDPALGAIPALGLGETPIDTYFPDPVLNSHWIVDEGLPSVVRDLSVSEDEVLRQALNEVSVVPLNSGDYSVQSITKDITLGRNTRLRLRGLAQGNLQGIVDVHYNRIDFHMVFHNGLVDVDLEEGATEQQVRDAVLSQHGVYLDPVTVTATDEGNGVWVFSALTDSLVFTGTMTVEAYPFWDGTPQTQGFYRVPDTPYIVYDQRLATSWGPLEIDGPLGDTFGRWTARINAQNAIDMHLGTDVAFTVLVQPNTPVACDLTFLRTGGFLLAYESGENIYLVQGTSTGYLGQQVATGTRPFLNRLTWDMERIEHDTYLFYTRDTTLYYRRYSEGFDTEYGVGIDNALTILSTNHDAMFRLVVHYLTVDGEIKNFSTEGGLVSALETPDYIAGMTGGNFTHS